MPEFFAAGGIVMWPLLFFSILATALIFERCRFWAKIVRDQRAIAQQFLETYPQNPQTALSQLKQHSHLPIARICLAALTLGEATPEEFTLALESAAQAELPLLKRFQTVLETITGVAPLLGLLGTVLGLIRALSALRLGDAVSQGTQGVTFGIGEALISTAAGLVIAITTLLFANLFQGLYQRQRAFIQEVGGKLEILYRRQNRRDFPRDRDIYRSR